MFLYHVGCVASGAKLYNKYADKIEGAMPQLKGQGNFTKGFNIFLQKFLMDLQHYPCSELVFI